MRVVFKYLLRDLNGSSTIAQRPMTTLLQPWIPIAYVFTRKAFLKKTSNLVALLRSHPGIKVNATVIFAVKCSIAWFNPASSTYPTAFFGANVRPPRLIRNAYRWFKQQLPSIDPTDLLPIGIDANKGVILCGNGSTPSLLVAEFRRAEGTFGIVQARSKLDFYKQILNFKFQNAVIRYVENQECQDPMTTTGRILCEHIEASRYS